MKVSAQRSVSTECAMTPSSESRRINGRYSGRLMRMGRRRSLMISELSERRSMTLGLDLAASRLAQTRGATVDPSRRATP